MPPPRVIPFLESTSKVSNIFVAGSPRLYWGATGNRTTPRGLQHYTRISPGSFHLCQHTRSHSSPTLAMASREAFKITELTRNDFDEWAALFKRYINFYKTSIPEEQYQQTFERILDPNSDLYALVMRQNQAGSANSKIMAIAHFFPEQTSWSQKTVMLLNGRPVD